MKKFFLVLFLCGITLLSCKSEKDRLKEENSRLWEEYRKKEEEIIRLEKRLDSLNNVDEVLMKEFLDKQDSLKK